MNWRSFFSRPNDDLDREIEAHLELEAEEQRHDGLSEEEARLAARRTFGNVTATKEATRESWGWTNLAATAVRDIRFALRTFRRKPTAYAFAVGVLAVGIGMTTALFSLVDAVVLQPLPFPDQQQLRVIWKVQPGNPRIVELAYPELRDLAEGVDALASVALIPTTAYANGRTLRAPRLEPVHVDTAPVTHSFFRTLGVEPMLGRDFSPSGEDGRVVIVSEHLWRDLLGADPAIIGAHIEIDGRAHEVIGVMPGKIDFPRNAKLWHLLPRATDRDGTWLQALVRIKPGYSDEQVESQIRNLFARQEDEYPQFYPKTQLPVVTPLSDYWTGSSRLQLSVSLGASLLLLIAACITAGNLFLSRALARKQEIAARICLGATAPRVFAQFAAEGLAAGAFASALGLAVAWALIRVLIADAPAQIPRVDEASLRGDVLALAIAVSFATAFVCSVAPTWLASRLNPATLLRDSPKLTGGRKTRLVQGAFTVAQSAVTVVLLAASLLVALSFQAMLAEDIGFSNRDAVTMHLNPRGPQYNPAAEDAFYTQLLDRLRESPLVDSAGAILLRPLAGPIGWDTGYRLDGQPEVPTGQLQTANFQVVTPGYFDTVGTRLLEGRDFTIEDDHDSEQRVIIGRSLAQRLRDAGQEPVGSRIRLFWREPWWRVIGVVADARYRGVRVKRDDLYMNYLQIRVPVRYPVVRGSASAAELAELVRQEAAVLDPMLAVGEVLTMGDLIERDTAELRFNMTLLLVFAVGAVLLAGAGVYSVVAEHVSERRKEIAIRIALGAVRSRLAARVVAATGLQVAAGALAGVLAVVALGPLAGDLLYSMAPDDPVVLTSVVAFVVAVSLVAAFVPAWTAAGREPRSVLQAD